MLKRSHELLKNAGVLGLIHFVIEGLERTINPIFWRQYGDNFKNKIKTKIKISSKSVLLILPILAKVVNISHFLVTIAPQSWGLAI